MEEWNAYIPPAPAPAEPPPKSGVGGIIAVQSVACLLALLLTLLLRFAGGTAYQQLRQSFADSLRRNDLPALLASLWERDPGEAAESILDGVNETAPAADDA